VAAVIGFGSSSKLGSAYGVAVTGTMLVTTFLTFFVIRYSWRYPLWLCITATGLFLAVDAVFFSAALVKVLEGGWFPLLLGIGAFFVMTTWRRGRELLFEQWNASSMPLDALLAALKRDALPRVPGTAVFLTAMPQLTPPALLHSLKHYKVMHERVVFLTVEFLEVPWIAADEQVAVEPLGSQFYRLRVRFGFMSSPDVMRALELAREQGLALDPMDTSFFVSRDKIVPYPGHRGMARWRDRLFAAMARNASNVTDFFNIPTNRVIELGTRVEI
jgi:KUP system potassium uptake protein